MHRGQLALWQWQGHGMLPEVIMRAATTTGLSIVVEENSRAAHVELEFLANFADYLSIGILYFFRRMPARDFFVKAMTAGEDRFLLPIMVMVVAGGLVLT